MVFALEVLLECSSSIITIKEMRSRWAAAMRSNRFFRSLSRMAVLPFFVTSSQLMKVVVPRPKPEVNASNRFCVTRCGANFRILSRLCSSRSPLPGHSQMNATSSDTLVRYSSIKSIRIIVLPEPVGDLTMMVCLLFGFVAKSSSLMTVCSWKGNNSIVKPGFTMPRPPPASQI